MDNNPFYIPSLQEAGQASVPGIDPYGLKNPGRISVPQGAQPTQSTQSPVNWSGAVSGALDLGINAYNMANQRLPYMNQQIAPSQYDQNTAPTYTAGAAYSEASGSHPQGAQTGEVLGAAGKGALAGTAVLPGIGTAVGAVAGAASSIIGGAARKKAEEKQKKQALGRAVAAQENYNQQDVTFRNQQNQRTQYLRRINPYAREYQVNQTRF